MLYIEQIPRIEGSPFWTTELMDIEAIREWILTNCDTTKPHVISSSRRGPVIAQGISFVGYYGWNYGKPIKKVFDRVVTNYSGYKVFTSPEEATSFYKESKLLAEAKLDADELEVNRVLNGLKEKGINLDATATALDDSGLESNLTISCVVNGFYFGRNI